MRHLQSKKKWVGDYNDALVLANDLEVLLEFHKEGDATPKEVDTQYLKALTAV